MTVTGLTRADTSASAEVVPLGPVEQVAPAVLSAHLGTVLGLVAWVAPAIPLPERTRMPTRAQHDAAQLVDLLGRDRRPGTLRIGLTEADLALPVFTHVFGEALVGAWVAVASMHRLQPGVDPMGDQHARKYERMVRVACHEAGHALGLTHCRREGCLMQFAGTVELLDTLTLGLCQRCREQLALHRQRLDRDRA